MNSIINEHVFIIGGTGNIGTKCVRELISKKIPVTLLARNPQKVSNLFPGVSSDALKVVQGDYNSDSVLKAALPGHTRLFLLVTDIEHMGTIKGYLATLAYASGIQQIVDISSVSVNDPWRSRHIGYKARLAEEAILAASTQVKGTSVVTLRPSRFMSNTIVFDFPVNDAFIDNIPHDTPQAWISTNDIGALAASILADDIEKHGNEVYTMVSQIVTPAQRADIFTRVLGRPISYKQVSAQERFDLLKNNASHFSFSALYDLVTYIETNPTISVGLPILLGREPETFEEYLEPNKHKLL
ncbi:hypothetical protein BCR42DRAFT_416937 [Absidia repens]|uniref:NmrA-like domain-containing protein n=1 Tax=Absidia repens TaxID=90262 RepID=A0A1X2IF68_9FUNG|nr:hypothetical protein BCR42DRAFT_416937 [Absidia repens]